MPGPSRCGFLEFDAWRAIIAESSLAPACTNSIGPIRFRHSEQRRFAFSSAAIKLPRLCVGIPVSEPA